jgi:general secretion pathway protein M
VNGLAHWWSARSEREQRLLLVMLALAVALGGWLLVVRPLADALDSARTRHAEAVIALAEARGRAELRRRVDVQAGAPALLPVDALLTGSAAEAGFSNARIAGRGAGRAIVAIDSARAPVFFGWVRRLEQSGLVVETLRAQANGDRTLAAEVAFHARAGR